MPTHNWHNAGSWSGGGYLVDYDYRYSTEYSGYYHRYKSRWYNARALTDSWYGPTPLFNEATAYRRYPNTTYEFCYETNSTSWKIAWAHKDGGNMITHGGDAFWLDNVYDTTSGPTFYSHSKGWPSGGVFTFYNYNGVGLDPYVSDRK